MLIRDQQNEISLSIQSEESKIALAQKISNIKNLLCKESDAFWTGSANANKFVATKIEIVFLFYLQII